MAMQFDNPFNQYRAEWLFFEIHKDGAWHADKGTRQTLHDKGFSRQMGPVLARIESEGARPYPPKFPLGRWRLERRGYQTRMVAYNPVEGMAANAAELKAIVEESVTENIQALIAAATADQMALVSKQIEELKKSSVPILELQSVTNGKVEKKKTVEPAHEMMQDLLYYLSLRDHVYLHDGVDGGPGSGKTTAAIMAAAALEIGKSPHFGYISLTPQTFESRIFGYMDAAGKYVSTDFRRCYEFGGVFIVDEGDNGGGNLYTALNGALENNICSFPDKIVKRHKDFVVVMTGNTCGSGPNQMFPTRRPFDKAFAERFTYIAWNYDIRLEHIVAKSINAHAADIWHSYMLSLRSYCRKHFPMVLVSPRATFKGCKYLRDGVISIERMLHSLVFKGVDTDTVNKIIRENPIPETELLAAIEAGKELAVARKKTKEVRRG